MGTFYGPQFPRLAGKAWIFTPIRRIAWKPNQSPQDPYFSAGAS